MIIGTEFKNISFFSKLFIDFIDGKLQEFFPSNYLDDHSKLFDKRLAETNPRRHIAVESIVNSMKSIEPGKLQFDNINLSRSDRTLFVATGQQPGALGGPLYSLFKAFSAICLSNELNEKYKDFNFIPLFWVEDNDSDLNEAASAVIFDKDYNLSKFNLNFVDKLKIEYQRIDEHSSDFLNKLIESCLLSDDYKQLLFKVNEPGLSWSDSFINAVNILTSDSGLLFIKSSELNKSQIFGEIFLKEINNPYHSQRIINQTSDKLLGLSYHKQAEPSDINLFFEENGVRLKIQQHSDYMQIGDKIIPNSEINLFVNDNIKSFLPKVLLRPIFQDYALPTSHYIGGPGEIAYLAQIQDLYSEFNLSSPVILNRHSFTLIDKSTQRGLEKYNLSPTYFLRSWNDIENELNQKFLNPKYESIFEESRQKISNMYNNLSDILPEIDNQITSNIDIALNKSIEQLENLRKKSISLLKRKNEDTFNKYRKMSGFILPQGKPQERVFNLINILMYNNPQNLIEKLLHYTQLPPDKHYFIEI